MNYRGFRLAWLVAWLLTAPAMAETLAVGELRLNTDATWQRADAEEEQSFDSIVLRGAGQPARLEVFLPRQRARPKEADRFIEQLEQSWRRRYGDQVELDWLEAAGQRWRVCRRPSRSGDGHVFQIVALHGGEAYQLVAVTPAEVAVLPEAVRSLLAGAAWADTPAAAKAEPVAAAAPSQAVAAPPPQAPVAPTVAPPAPAPVKLGGRWRLLRQVVALPGGKDWPALAEAEGRLLGAGSLVKGLGLSNEAAALSGFLEGVLWQKGEGAGEVRQPFRRQWQVRWPDLPGEWQGGRELVFDLDFLGPVPGPAVAGDLRVRLEVLPACGPRLELVRWLDALEAQGSAAIERIAALPCHAPDGAPAATVVGVAASDYPAGGEARLSRRVALPLPPDWEQRIRARQHGDSRRLILIARFATSESGQAPGDAMFGRAYAVFVFGPEV